MSLFASSFTTGLIATLLTGAALFDLTETVLASPQTALKQPVVRFVPPPPPPRRGAPRGRRGAGSRGDCQEDPSARTITALMPPGGFGLTLESHPTPWFHVPYGAQDFHSAAFVLRNAQRQTLYRTRLSSTELLAAGSEWVGLALPEEMEPLAIAPSPGEGPVYDWQFVIYCQDPALDPSASVFVSGSMQRIKATDELQATLGANLNSLERAGVMAEAGIWFATLRHVAEVGCAASDGEATAELTPVWHSLLADPNVDLPDLTETSPPACALRLER